MKLTRLVPMLWRHETWINPITFYRDSELWQQIKERATVVYPLEDFEYGMREFAIRDNNGYILQFGQEI